MPAYLPGKGLLQNTTADTFGTPRKNLPTDFSIKLRVYVLEEPYIPPFLPQAFPSALQCLMSLSSNFPSASFSLVASKLDC